MFYTATKYFFLQLSFGKKYLPKSIFSRFILIIIAPTIITQLFSAYIFYERHWSNVIAHMSYNLIGEMQVISNIYKNEDLRSKGNLIDIVKTSLRLQFKFVKNATIQNTATNFTTFLRPLSQTLSLPVNIIDRVDEIALEVEIQLQDGVLHIYVPRKRLENPTTYIFILWMMGAATVFSLLSIFFLRNQLHSIRKLANAAQSLGKGGSIGDFKPSGAIEVRKAGIAFLQMKQRIEKQIEQRTQMLAGVSHDLRTPLTRMKLQLAMLEQSEEVIEMNEDVMEMGRMIEHYLDFARGEEGEKTVMTNVANIIRSCIGYYSASLKKIDLLIEDNIVLPIKINAFKRAITNLMDNSAKYATKVIVHGYCNRKYWILEIEDNGPGIDKKEQKKVLNAFYRIDNSRNSNTGGVGLGLSICKEIISDHGGRIILDKSDKLKGLKVIIRIPL